MTTLNLFPARIRFVNADGTLTPEAFRALKILFDRVGGALGDNGVDVFAAFGGGNADSLLGEVLAREMLVQPTSPDECFLPDVLQPTGCNVMDKLVVKAGTAAAPSITTQGDENTGVYFPAADQMAVSTGGTARLTVTNTGTTLAGNTTIQGVTATGATGTGQLVFANSPTLVTPNLGTPSALVGTNITGTAAGLTVGNAINAAYATNAGSAPTNYHVHKVTVGGTTYTTTGPI